jgi:hypothetical protein
MISLFLAQPVFITSGLYREICRYGAFPSMVTLARAILIQPISLRLFIGASRSAARVWLVNNLNQPLATVQN